METILIEFSAGTTNNKGREVSISGRIRNVGYVAGFTKLRLIFSSSQPSK